VNVAFQSSVQLWNKTAGTGNPWRYYPQSWPPAAGDVNWIWNENSRTYPPAHRQGDVYFRKEFTLLVDGTYAVYIGADQRYEAYIDSQPLVTTPDGGNWTAMGQASVTLKAGFHTLAVKATCLSPQAGAFILVMYRQKPGDDSTAGSPVLAERVVESDPTWVCNAYPSSPPGWTPGEILATLFKEAGTRGVWAFQSGSLALGFTRLYDSNGVLWSTALPWTFSIGQDDYSSVVDKLSEIEMDVWIDPNTFTFNAYSYKGEDRTQTAAVQIEAGQSMTSGSFQMTADYKTAVLVQTKADWREMTNSYTTDYGRLETYLAATSYDPALGIEVGNMYLGTKMWNTESAPAEYEPLAPGAPIPWEYFQLGDSIMVSSYGNGDMQARRVMSIAVSMDDATGRVKYSLELDTISKTKFDRVNRALKGIAAGGKAGEVVYNTYGAAAPSNDYRVPATPTGAPIRVPAQPIAPTILSNTFTTTTVSQSPVMVANIGIAWTPVTVGIDADPMTPGSYDAVIVTSESPFAYTDRKSIAGTLNTVTFFNLVPGNTYKFAARAISPDLVPSNWSSTVSVVAAGDTTPPPVPTAPTVTPIPLALGVAWDGNLLSAIPKDFDHITVYMGTSPGFALSAGLRVTTMSKSGAVTLSLTTSGVRYFKFTSTDAAGNESAPSTEVSGTPLGVGHGDLTTGVGGLAPTIDAKNTNTYSTATPSVVGTEVAGDRWIQQNPPGKTIAQWVWSITPSPQWVSELVAGSALAQNSVTMSNLTITSVANLIDNAQFTSVDATGKPLAWTVAGGTLTGAPTGSRGGGPAAVVAHTAGTVTTLTSARWGAQVGQYYRHTWWVYSSVALASGQFVLQQNVYLNTGSTSTSNVYSSPAIPANTWTQVTTTTTSLFVTPANTLNISASIWIASAVANGTITVDQVIVNLANDGTLVVDGAMDAKSITGPLIRTAASPNPRIEIVGTSYGTQGIFDYGPGNVLVSSWTPGSFNIVNGSIVGGTVTGALVQTATSGRRVEITTDSGGLGWGTANFYTQAGRKAYIQVTGSGINDADTTFMNLETPPGGWGAGIKSAILALSSDVTFGGTVLLAGAWNSTKYAQFDVTGSLGQAEILATNAIAITSQGNIVIQSTTATTLTSNNINILSTGGIQLMGSGLTTILAQNSTNTTLQGDGPSLFVQTTGSGITFRLSTSNTYAIINTGGTYLFKPLFLREAVGSSTDQAQFSVSAVGTLTITTTAIQCAAVYNTTTTGTANVVVVSSGTLQRSTSLSAHKLDQQVIPANYAILDLDTKTWIDKGMWDADHSYTQRIAGSVAEDVHALSMANDGAFDALVDRNEQGDIENLEHERFYAYLLPVMRDMAGRLDVLELAVFKDKPPKG
jgi:hypothetical protein